MLYENVIYVQCAEWQCHLAHQLPIYMHVRIYV